MHSFNSFLFFRKHNFQLGRCVVRALLLPMHWADYWNWAWSKHRHQKKTQVSDHLLHGFCEESQKKPWWCTRPAYYKLSAYSSKHRVTMFCAIVCTSRSLVLAAASQPPSTAKGIKCVWQSSRSSDWRASRVAPSKVFTIGWIMKCRHRDK